MRTRARWLTVGVVVVAAIGIATFAYADRATPRAKVAATARVQRGVVTLTSSAAGTVQPAQSRGLSFSTGGTVTEIDVKPGDQVAAGQVLARMDNTGVRDEVNSAQASMDAASDALARAQQTSAPTASACQDAPADYHPSASAGPSPSGSPTPSATPAPSTPPVQPTSSPRPTSSTRPAATGQPTRGAPAGQNGVRSGNCGTSTGTGGRSGGDSLMSAEQQLTNATLALRLAQNKLDGTTITAPVGGKVLSVAGTVGAQQTPGGNGFIVLGEVADTAVRAQFSEADVARLAVGQSATITLPNKDSQQLTGKVSQIDPAGTASGRLVRFGVLIAFDAVPPDLLLGQSANVAVTTASAADVAYVPSAAVTGDATVTVRSHGRDQRRTVLVGLRGDRYTEIRSGLAEGDEVVIH